MHCRDGGKGLIAPWTGLCLPRAVALATTRRSRKQTGWRLHICRHLRAITAMTTNGERAARGPSAIAVEPTTSTFILRVRTSIRRICVAGATTYLVLRKLCQQYHTSKHMCCTAARVHTRRGIQAQLQTSAEVGLREQPVLRHMLILFDLVHGERHTSPLKNDVANGQQHFTRYTQHSQFQRCSQAPHTPPPFLFDPRVFENT